MFVYVRATSYFHLIICTFSLADVKYEVLSLGCRKGDLECVKMMINKYDCDPKGLWFTIIVCFVFDYGMSTCCQFPTLIVLYTSVL